MIGSERDDIAAWVPSAADLGKNMLLTSASGGPSSCVSTAFETPIFADPDGNGPLLVEDLDGDACGDVNGVNDTFTREFTNADVVCEGAVGGAEVDALVSWHLSGNDPVCSDHKDYGNFKKSKCSYTTSFVDLIVVGNLEVCKAAVEGTDGDFSFAIEAGTVWVSGTGADLEPLVAESVFILNPADGTGGVVCTSFDVMTTQETSNEVMIFETGVPAETDFRVTDISCVNNTEGGGPVDFNRLEDGFSIKLTEGDLGQNGVNAGQSDVTCTFTNAEGGSLTIVKDAVPNSHQVFSFSGDMGDFDLDDDGNGGLPKSATFDNLEDDVYTVIEAPVAGWTLTAAACEDDVGAVESSLVEGALSVGVANGQNVTCTFTNVQQGIAVVRKEVLPADDTTGFEFSGNIAGTISGGNELSLVIPVPPAEGLTSTELVPAGWDLVSIECDDENSSGSGDTATFNVEPGEIVTCVFTNVKQGNIRIDKTAIGDDGEFFFSRNFGDDFSIVTSGGSGSQLFAGLSASDEVIETSYSVSEITDSLGRWDYDGVVCTGADGVAEDNLAIDLEPGETVNCVFTNTKWSSITVVKRAYGLLDDEVCFEITGPEAQTNTACQFTQRGYGDMNMDNVMPGDWSIVELLDDDALWVLASATCDNGDSPGALSVAPGDDVTCTFINVPPGPVPVNNIWALILMVLMVLAGAWYFLPGAIRKS
jgi:hypothetical protein